MLVNGISVVGYDGQHGCNGLNGLFPCCMTVLKQLCGYGVEEDDVMENADVNTHMKRLPNSVAMDTQYSTELEHRYKKNTKIQISN